MRKPQKSLLATSIILVFSAVIIGCEAPATLTVVQSPTPLETPGPSAKYGAAIKAVDLIDSWVDAGASEVASFEYVGVDGNSCPATFEVDILPLFTENGLWFDGAQACTGCHFGNTENSNHEMDLSSYAGIMAGGDVLSKPPGVPILR